ncbi:MAG: hypothetical protein GQ583_11840 [Methyloprofundus sp.]|nr:hypothetical protein [Methyloprofundus sp.]
MNNVSKTLLCGVFLFSSTAGLSTNVAYAETALQSDIKETIKHKIVGLNGFSWYYGFDIELKKQVILLNVAINLIPAPGVSRVELSQTKSIWKKAIENTWSNQYAIKTNTGAIYPILITVSFRALSFHHSVIVRPGKGSSDELNWNVRDSQQTVAHEFGHMLGAFDEYLHGANDPANPIIDSSSIMSSLPKSGKIYARHFHKIQAWFLTKTAEEVVQLIALKQ